ncbi:MAG: type II secretion system GspH family protein [Gemmatimonadota bacterium]|nr:type II secretion system GspH family protein [Gemmatimonadota bacterium]
MWLRSNSARSGLSLAELVVVIALLGLTGAGIGSAILSQQRFHRDASALLDARQGVRDAMEVLSGDIRGSWPADTLRLMADSALELFATIGASVACRTTSGGAISLAAESATGNTLSSFLVAPDSGDVALVFRRSSDETAGRWERHRIADFGTRSSVVGCLIDGTGPAEGFVVNLGAIPEPALQPGASIRFIRRARYSLYRSSDGSWHLGYRRCTAVGCAAIQPLSGPYRRYSPDETQTGFLFEYFDSEGVRLGGDSPLSVARIDVTARSEKTRGTRARGPGNPPPESATASIALRNR